MDGTRPTPRPKPISPMASMYWPGSARSISVRPWSCNRGWCWVSRRSRAPMRCSPAAPELRRGRAGRCAGQGQQAGAGTPARFADHRSGHHPGCRSGGLARYRYRGGQHPGDRPAEAVVELADRLGLFIVGGRSTAEAPLFYLIAGEPSGDVIGRAPDGGVAGADRRRRALRRDRRRADGGIRAGQPPADPRSGDRWALSS